MQIANNYPFNLNFRAMKPNQFNGIDYAVVRKYKAPVEKFNSNVDFQDWAFNLFKNLANKTFNSQIMNAHYKRKFSLNKWKDFLLQKTPEWSCAKLLLIYSSITNDLKENNSKIPPIINPDLLDKTFKNLEAKLDENKDLQFDFNKMYQKQLKTSFLQEIPKNYTGWVVLPSKKKDPINFENNVERLNLLSNSSWCTKKWCHAETYLKGGDFHLYLENGLAKLCLRFSGCELQEAQVEKNNSIISKEYLNILKDYIKQNKFFVADDLSYLIEVSEKA